MDADVAELINALRTFDTDHRHVEAKRAQTALPKKLWESLSAFANAPGGGVILLGVDESAGFVVTGVDDPQKVMSDLASMCDTMHPPLRPPITLHRIDGKTVISCEVAELTLDQKPCYYTGAGLKNGAFIRVADGDRQLSDYEVYALRTAGGHPRDDEEPVQGATVDDLDPELLRPFMATVRETRRAFATSTDDEILRRLKVLVHVKASDTWVPSLAGLLVFGRDPQQHFPQLNATVVVYPGDSIRELGPNGERFLDNVRVDAPIPVAVGQILDGLHRNMRRPNVADGTGRANRWELPDEALREAIVNALVHRDLNALARGMPVQVQLFRNRLVIASPGGLFGPVTVDRLGEDGVSSSRNQTLMRILEDVSLPGAGHTVAENRGSGIGAMIDAIRRARMRPPTFEDTIATFRVTFPRESLIDTETLEWLATLGWRADGLTDDQRAALALMHRGETMTNQRYRQVSRCDSRDATRDLRELAERGLVTTEGVGRWTAYRLAPTHPAPQAPPIEVAAPERDRGVRPGLRLVPDADDSGGHAPRRADRRADILRLLRQRGPMSRAEIQVALGGLTNTPIIRWLALLRQEGLVELTTAAPRHPHAQYRLTNAAPEAE